MRTLLHIASACLLPLLLSPLVLVAQEPPAEAASPEPIVVVEEPSRPQTAESVRQRLREPITLELNDVSLDEALKELFAKHDLDFWIDQAGLEKHGIAVEEVPITCRMRNVSVRAALQRLLSAQDLSWVCEDAGVRITTKDQMEIAHFARIYDVTGLIEAPLLVDAPELATKTAQLGTDPYTQIPPTGPVKTPEDSLDEAYTRLMKLIHIAILAPRPPEEQPWSTELMVPHRSTTTNLLIIRQNEMAHGQIEDLLNDILLRQSAEEELSEPQEKNAQLKSSPPRTVRIVSRIPAAR